MVERPPRVREVAGLIPGRVTLKTFKMVVMTALLGGQSCAGLALRYSGWRQDEWTSSTGNLNRKRFDISETLLKSALNTKQSFHGVLFHSPIECLLFHGDVKRLLERVNTVFK